MIRSTFRKLPTLALTLMAAGTVLAADIPAAIQSDIVATLDKVLPDTAYKAIVESPIPGIYQVSLEGGGFLFVTPDGQYVITGELYQVSVSGLENLTENERKVGRKAQLAQLKPADMIVFSPKGKTKALLYVFTDVDCGYCQKLHREVPQLTEKGVEVRYLAFPRGGLASVGYAKIATAWCDKNPQQALTDLKNGKKLALNVCENNSVAKDYQLGNDMGVQGTPALVMADGTMIPGYRPAAELLEILGLN